MYEQYHLVHIIYYRSVRSKSWRHPRRQLTGIRPQSMWLDAVLMYEVYLLPAPFTMLVDAIIYNSLFRTFEFHLIWQHQHPFFFFSHDGGCNKTRSPSRRNRVLRVPLFILVQNAHVRVHSSTLPELHAD